MALREECGGELKPKGYYDQLKNRKPADPRPGNTPWHQLYSWSPFHPRFGQTAPKGSGGAQTLSDKMEKRAQNGPHWLLSVNKLSLGFSGLSHNLDEQTLSKAFGGVLEPQATSKHTHAWDWDTDAKFTRFGPHADWFASETMQYSSSFVAAISGPRSETQSRNRMEYDGGSYLHLFHTGNQLPKLSLVLGSHFESQVFDPIASVKIDTAPLVPSSSTLTFLQGRTNLLLARSGLRWQNRRSYIEGGLEGGQTLNAIKRFDLRNVAGGPVITSCFETSQSLQDCINAYNQLTTTTVPITASSLVTPVRGSQNRYGAYWKMAVTLPVYQHVSYKFEDTSDFFFLSRGDNSANTRYRHDLVNTLKFNIFPNLSFEPTYRIFLYENKLEYRSLFQQQYMIRINYAFDLSNWHERDQGFEYKKPSSP